MYASSGTVYPVANFHVTHSALQHYVHTPQKILPKLDNNA